MHFHRLLLPHGNSLWNALTLPPPLKYPLVIHSIPDSLNQISLGIWPGNLQLLGSSAVETTDSIRALKTLASGSNPAPRLFSVSPVILESSHSHLCVYCPWCLCPASAELSRPMPVWLMLLKYRLWFSVAEVLHPILPISILEAAGQGGGMYTLFVSRKLVTELWVPASSVPKGCGEAPSQMHLAAQHVACLKESSRVPATLCAYTSVLYLLPGPSMNPCDTEWLAPLLTWDPIPGLAVLGVVRFRNREKMVFQASGRLCMWGRREVKDRRLLTEVFWGKTLVRRCLDLSEKALPEKGLERTHSITLRLWPEDQPSVSYLVCSQLF